MTPERWRQIDEILDCVLECEPSERRECVQRLCAGDIELRAEVEALLRAHERSHDFIEKPPLIEMQRVLQPETGWPDARSDSSKLVGQTLGHYEIKALIGAGGMGEVYRARDTRLDREVAVKILTRELALKTEALKRFEREAKSVAALSHPNILAIHDFGAEGEIHYTVSELLKGETLRERLMNTGLNRREAIEIAIQIAEGLNAAHLQGIIHRDLKPENIFLTNAGVVKILDFGIARIKTVAAPILLAQGSTVSNMTAPGRIIGTFGYMSPEQVRGEEVDTPSDIFAFGCVLYEMLFGQRPFTRATTAETMAAILRDEPLLAATKFSSLPATLKRLVERCLAKQPEDRYQSSGEVAAALKEILSQTGPARFHLPSRRKIMWIALVLILGVALWSLNNWWKRETIINSLAVMPLVSANPDPEIDSLADGVIEGVITHLSEIPNLRVMARSTVFRIKEQALDPQQAGRQLKVKAVLTGRIARKGETVVISTELVNVADGSLLWGEKYARPLSDLTPLQTEIAERISEHLNIPINSENRVRLQKRNTVNSEAYQLYLYGRYQLNKRSDEAIIKSIDYFKQAVAKDPEYALAYAGLADAYFLGSGTSPLERNVALPQAKVFAGKAVEMDPNSGEAQTSLAMLQLFYDYDWKLSEQGFKRAIACNPGYVTAHHWYGILLYAQGRFKSAQQELQIAQDLDPLSLPLSTEIGRCHYFAREYQQAAAQFQRTLELDENWIEARRWLAGTYFQQHRETEAIAEYLRIATMSGEKAENIAALRAAAARDGMRGYWRQRIAIFSDPAKINSVSPFSMASLHANVGEKEEAIFWLEKAFVERINGTRDVSGLLYLKVDPRFDLLRKDIRFRQLLQTIGVSSP